MLKRKSPSQNSEKGISTVELVPVLLLFALLFNFSLGFFGVIHSGILNSIAARNYAFETFRNRTNLTYLRDAEDAVPKKEARFTKVGYRFHGIVAEKQGSRNQWVATQRPIKFTEVQTGEIDPVGTAQDHQQLVRQVADSGKVSQVFSGHTADDGKSGVSPIWIQTLYGICLNSKCQPLR